MEHKHRVRTAKGAAQKQFQASLIECLLRWLLSCVALHYNHYIVTKTLTHSYTTAMRSAPDWLLGDIEMACTRKASTSPAKTPKTDVDRRRYNGYEKRADGILNWANSGQAHGHLIDNARAAL